MRTLRSDSSNLGRNDTSCVQMYGENQFNGEYYQIITQVTLEGQYRVDLTMFNGCNVL